MKHIHWSITDTRNAQEKEEEEDQDEDEDEMNNQKQHDLIEQQRTSFLNGFQMATQHGPLCEEPLWGVIYRIQNIQFLEQLVTREDERNDDVKIDGDNGDGDENDANIRHQQTISTTTITMDPYGPLSGQIISTMKRTCRESFSKSSRRLVEAVFECNMQCTAEQLGKLYSVLGQRRCTILYEDMIEGTSIFTIKGRIPVAETVGLVDHMRKETSGGVSSPQLHFDRWQLLEIDPFFQPKTDQEREEFGEIRHAQQSRNIAKEYIDKTRERKGLSTNKKIVVDAEKQRTLTRNK
jgi:ribosome assembly protein 1